MCCHPWKVPPPCSAWRWRQRSTLATGAKYLVGIFVRVSCAVETENSHRDLFWQQNCTGTFPFTCSFRFSVHTEDHYWIVFNYAGQPSFNESDPVNVSLRGSTTATIPLPAGTVVQVQNYNATTVYGSDVLGVYSWFSGFLLSTK